MTARRRKVDAAIKLRSYDIIRRAVSEGVAYGCRRAHKYVEHPSEDAIIEAVENGVMAELCEVLSFPGGDE